MDPQHVHSLDRKDRLYGKDSEKGLRAGHDERLESVYRPVEKKTEGGSWYVQGCMGKTTRKD